MPRLITLFLFCLLSFAASAQDVQYSFAGTTLSKRDGHYFTTSAKVLKDGKLKAATSGYSVVSYQISFLPSRGDLHGPYKLAAGQDLPVVAKNFLQKNTYPKIFLDDIIVKGPDGKTFKGKNFKAVCQ